MSSIEKKLEDGAELHRQGRLAEAERIYREVLADRPRSFDALNLLSIVVLQTGRNDEAAQLAARASAINANVAQTRNTHATALRNLNRYAEALIEYDAALALNRDFFPAMMGRAYVLSNLRRFEDAYLAFARLAALRPDQPEIRNNLGVTLLQLARFEDALASFEVALRLKGDYAAAHKNKGTALQGLGRLDEAVAAFDRALALDPSNAQAHNNLGTALFDLGHFGDAVASYDRAIERDSVNPEAFTNRGLALMELGRVREAIANFETAIHHDPDHAEAIYNRGAAALLLGDFENGWRDYEARKTKPKPVGHRKFPYPLWMGEGPLIGKTILVHHEQGLGDTIQFCRYVAPIEEAGAKVLLAPQPALKALMEGLAVRLNVMPRIVDPNGVYPDADLHCPMMSLPGAFRTRLNSIPHRVPYLAADAARVARWRTRIGENGFRIGICWQGSDAKIDRGRSFSVTQFARLARLPNVRLISLHKGSGEAQLADLPEDVTIETLGDDFDSGRDAFLDTAAAMEICDLVITSDTAIAHLAGALARPTWIVLRNVPDWRWLLGQPDYENRSPWYPTLRLYRQREPGDWAEVFGRMERDLRKMVPPA